MILLAIDPGTHSGWCVRFSAAAWTSGVWDLSAKRHEGGGMRFLRLRTYLREVLDRERVDAVFYEEVRRHLGVDAAHIYGGCIAVIAEECEARKVPYRGIPVATVKKLATGKGNASKDDMIAAAKAKWPMVGVTWDDNEADARWIAEAGAKELGA